MSYTAYYQRLPLSLPQGLGLALAGYLYINVFNGKPPVGLKEVSKAEWNATPQNYLQNPEHHATRFPKVPGQKNIEDGYGHLMHKAHEKQGHH